MKILKKVEILGDECGEYYEEIFWKSEKSENTEKSKSLQSLAKICMRASEK